ncbi:glycosyltransferase family 4 protein [Limnoraphis robusta]|uniref:Glycosyltransferase family 4 protein n=1 Tax=Limnoraphis robusta CCNP1315 TaxID=3110306 RepID=A0ABU5U6D0_9CYAN|nr:glycosyltransferase family 4 protein [Limnoraphis robusta]MEA5500601.1 glycosyltransferase family 4 protein [Limnoraphis robusta BA-68 BA1]MEA5522752.1 glycosyltransferase family 4 protein [Limnoraphis robusta CCNP1315]MEA5543786.1 glycosyltransferase family 4 protein [Limnoraphis robusta CCNP1324]
MMRQVNIGYYSAKNYLDKNTFSGTLYHMHRALSHQNINLINLGNPSQPSMWKKPLKLVKKASSLLNKKDPDPNLLYEQFYQSVQKTLSKTPCDLIFAPVSSKELGFLETDLPIIYLSDATPKLIKQTYKIYSSEEEFLQASQQEVVAFKKATKVIYSSEWAAHSAINDYEVDPNKIEIVPFGANVDTIPEASEILKKCQVSKCHLLFIGKDWERKGGNIAYQTLLSLLDLGVDAELLMIGCVPPSEFQHEKLKVIPFLNKNIPEEQEQFSQLLLNSHFLVFPTRADCSPIVICEANAYGIPVITTDAGGIPTILKEGKNGYMLPLSAGGDEYAKLIATHFSNKETYEQLVRSSREEYDDRLNWNKWAESTYKIMINMLQ